MVNYNITVNTAHGTAVIDGSAVTANATHSTAEGAHTIGVVHAVVVEAGIVYRISGWVGNGDSAASGVLATQAITLSQTTTMTISWYTEGDINDPTSLQCPGCGCYSFEPDSGEFGDQIICMVCGYNLTDNPALSES